MAKLTLLVETLKTAGLSATECSRIRQYERWVCETFEILRQIKMYRTPQALRSFARIFTVFLPPFYAPRFAQIAIDVNSLGVGIAMALITTLALTALFESIQVLEDPFGREKGEIHCRMQYHYWLSALFIFISLTSVLLLLFYSVVAFVTLDGIGKWCCSVCVMMTWVLVMESPEQHEWCGVGAATNLTHVLALL